MISSASINPRKWSADLAEIICPRRAAGIRPAPKRAPPHDRLGGPAGRLSAAARSTGCPCFALVVQALIERELRLAMKRENVAELPLYPEQRPSAHPTTKQILGLVSLA